MHFAVTVYEQVKQNLNAATPVEDAVQLRGTAVHVEGTAEVTQESTERCVYHRSYQDTDG